MKLLPRLGRRFRQGTERDRLHRRDRQAAEGPRQLGAVQGHWRRRRAARPAEDDRGLRLVHPDEARSQAPRRGDRAASTRPASCSSAAVPSPAWKRSSPGVWGGVPAGSASGRRQTSSPVEEGDILRHVLPEDLQAFGMIPEFVGRLPIIATLDDLGEAELTRILADPNNALLKQYRKLLRLAWGRPGVHARCDPGDRPDGPRAGRGGQGAAGRGRAGRRGRDVRGVRGGPGARAS